MPRTRMSDDKNVKRELCAPFRDCDSVEVHVPEHDDLPNVILVEIKNPVEPVPTCLEVLTKRALEVQQRRNKEDHAKVDLSLLFTTSSALDNEHTIKAWEHVTPYPELHRFHLHFRPPVSASIIQQMIRSYLVSHGDAKRQQLEVTVSLSSSAEEAHQLETFLSREMNIKHVSVEFHQELSTSSGVAFQEEVHESFHTSTTDPEGTAEVEEKEKEGGSSSSFLNPEPSWVCSKCRLPSSSRKSHHKSKKSKFSSRRHGKRHHHHRKRKHSERRT
jgi:hypothetical protein